MIENITERKEVNRVIILNFKNEEDIKNFEVELYSLAQKHNLYILIKYD